MAFYQIFDIQPIVRTINLINQNIPTFTLGRGSYVVDCRFENTNEREHILIGSYCSIAIGSKFLLGINHDFGSVSTFPYDSPFFQKYFNKGILIGSIKG